MQGAYDWFDIDSIMRCGQVFHFIKVDEGYLGHSDGRAIYIAEKDGQIVIDINPRDAAYFHQYFDMDRDYRALAESFSCDDIVYKTMVSQSGLRILRQKPWEALLAFILSSNNNIARIQGLVLRILERFGKEICHDKGRLYAFPEPQDLAGEEEALRALGCGYRASYIEKTARMLCEGFMLDALADMDYETAHQKLLLLPGVGDKVADCVQLFSLGHTIAFPEDVWIKRCLLSYGIVEKNREKRLIKIRERFGDHAGIVQQFLFHDARMATQREK